MNILGEIGAWIIAGLGIISTLLGISINIYNAQRNIKADTSKTSREDGEILTRLGYI